jgi:hypothetical protein
MSFLILLVRLNDNKERIICMRNFLFALMVFVSTFIADVKYRFTKYEKAKGSSLTQDEKTFIKNEAWQQAMTHRGW